jgi:hypothetical protein
MSPSKRSPINVRSKRGRGVENSRALGISQSNFGRVLVKKNFLAILFLGL